MENMDKLQEALDYFDVDIVIDSEDEDANFKVVKNLFKKEKIQFNDGVFKFHLSLPLKDGDETITSLYLVQNTMEDMQGANTKDGFDVMKKILGRCLLKNKEDKKGDLASIIHRLGAKDITKASSIIAVFFS